MLIKTFASATVMSAALAGVMSAQTSPTTTQTSPTTTLVGCVYQEKDVPGRAPNLAERAGLFEDYILAEISPAEAAKPVGTSGAAGAPTTYSMYKLEDVADSELKALVGKRVEVMGQIDTEEGDATGQAPASARTSDTDRVIGRDRINLAEFEVSSIRAIEGTCPAQPTLAR
jgi:hypothetical protein